ncbi:putative hydrolase, alpha/beta fold protein [Mycolicibacterium anyangense]|uniref:Putative hydrolase, alpha/beta fold protein n=1 Tax=Mycolicibacterium anyangense TaxID=1431246 RepID=A0A6N4WDE8_9MYCO|nr:alpha/beta hydrolase [Mycolicibacterium anyangense]BBZ78134.1 putative hydrolase, alpha/beta fold protein [Mycolicibacterium anyangense]
MPTDVTFQSANHRCHAWHFTGTGDEFLVDDRRPCVVMGHGFSATKDSGLAEYAERLAAAGLDVLAFDYRHFGANSVDGVPAEVNPRSHEADFRAAVHHARSLPGVDPERIVIWGVSLSSGHVMNVAAQDSSVAAVIAMTPAVDGVAAIRVAIRRSPIAAARMAWAALRDTAAALSGRPRVTVAVVGEPGATAVMSAPGAATGYTQMAGPSAVNGVPARSVLRAALYRPLRRAHKISCPVLVQIADNDMSAPPQSARTAAFRCRADVRHYPCDHFDVYPGSDWFEPAVAHQLHFLRRHFAPASKFAPVDPLVLTS